MELIESVVSFLDAHRVKRGAKIIVACSGGRDSMVLAHALIVIGQNIEIAHVNYQLRGKSSDLDEQLVTQFAQKNEIPFHLKKATFISKPSCLQKWAREERYSFFDTLNAEFIATAHHQEDQIETAFIQLLRGHRITGMPDRRGQIIRPLLQCTNGMIKTFQESHRIRFREDESNETDAYLRNRIRHRMTPLLDDIRPRARKNILRAISETRSDQDVIEVARNQWCDQYTRLVKNETFIAIKKIPVPHAKTIVSAICQPFGFHRKQIEQLLDAHRGAYMRSKGWLITVEQDQWCIHRNKKKSVQEIKSVVIDSEGISQSAFGTLTIDFVEQVSREEMASDAEFIDADSIVFPLRLRRWRNGDRMRPIGMKGRSKKITDLLKESDIPSRHKRDQLVLEDAQKNIIWLIDIRLSEAYKITSNTKRIARLMWTSRI